MITIEHLIISLIPTSRSLLRAGCATGLLALITLPPFALAQAPSLDPSDPLGAQKTTLAPNALEADTPGPHSDEVAESRAPQEPLDWTQNPGAFEQALRRRVSNPLFPVERQRVGKAELRAAKIRDASDARAVLSAFVDLSLDRRKLARVKTIEEIELALVRYQTVRHTVMGVGGEVGPLVDALTLSRVALIERWRVAHEDHPEILAALELVAELDAESDPASHNEFAAQLLREDGPIRADELAPALLSEPPDTIKLVLTTFSPEQRSEIQLTALGLIADLQILGVQLEDEQAKVDLLLADGSASSDPEREPRSF